MRLYKNNDTFEIHEISEYELEMLGTCLAAYSDSIGALLTASNERQIEILEKSRDQFPNPSISMSNEEMLNNFRSQYDFMKSILTETKK